MDAVGALGSWVQLVAGGGGSAARSRRVARSRGSAGGGGEVVRCARGRRRQEEEQTEWREGSTRTWRTWRVFGGLFFPRGSLNLNLRGPPRRARRGRCARGRGLQRAFVSPAPPASQRPERRARLIRLRRARTGRADEWHRHRHWLGPNEITVTQGRDRGDLSARVTRVRGKVRRLVCAVLLHVQRRRLLEHRARPRQRRRLLRGHRVSSQVRDSGTLTMRGRGNGPTAPTEAMDAVRRSPGRATWELIRLFLNVVEPA